MSEKKQMPPKFEPVPVAATEKTEIGERPTLTLDPSIPWWIRGPNGQRIADCSSSLVAGALINTYNAHAALIEQRDWLLNVFALDEPWPLRDVLDKLRAATAHLLDVHSCDTHGHEEFRTAMRQAETLIGRIDAALAKQGAGK